MYSGNQDALFPRSNSANLLYSHVCTNETEHICAYQQPQSTPLRSQEQAYGSTYLQITDTGNISRYLRFMRPKRRSASLDRTKQEIYVLALRVCDIFPYTYGYMSPGAMRSSTESGEIHGQNVDTFTYSPKMPEIYAQKRLQIKRLTAYERLKAREERTLAHKYRYEQSISALSWGKISASYGISFVAMCLSSTKKKEGRGGNLPHKRSTSSLNFFTMS